MLALGTVLADRQGLGELLGKETRSGSGAEEVASAWVSRDVESLSPEGASRVREPVSRSLACPRKLWGFRLLVGNMEVLRIKAACLAVVKMELGEGVLES